MLLFLLVIELFISCTDDNDIEEEFHYESQSNLDNGGNNAPLDNVRDRQLR